MQRLAHHVVYRGNCILNSNEMIIDIILMRVWHTISSFKLVFKRGQGRSPYILMLLGKKELSCDFSKYRYCFEKKVIKSQRIDNIN